MSPPASRYPKINLAVGYRVDPDWPQKPSTVRWRYVTGVAVDSQDRVWVLNEMAPQVQVYDRAGRLVEAWGAALLGPHAVRFDGHGDVWVVDYRRHVVQKFSPRGELLLTLGTADAPGCDATHLNGPTDVAISPAGEAFVTDGYGNNRIVRFTPDGQFAAAWGELGVAPGQLSQPHSVVLDSRGRVYVGERNNCRIQVFTQSGESLAQWRHLVNPWGLWITPQDEILVCGSAPARWSERHNLGNPPTDQLLLKFDTEGRALELWHLPLCLPGTQVPGELDWVHGIAADSQGNLYLGDVADDSPSHRVQKFVRLPAES